LRRQPNHFWAQYVAALCDLRARRWSEASAGLSACLGLRPDFASWPRLLRGSAEGELGRYAAAEEDFTRALQERSDDAFHAAVYVARGVVRVHARRWKQAVADLHKAIDLQPSTAAVYVNLSAAEKGWSQWAAALGQLTGVAGRLATEPQEHADAAVSALDKAIVRSPRDAALYLLRARLHEERGNLTAARHDFEQAIAHEHPGAAERLASSLVHLGYLQHQNGEYEAALASFAAALKARPHFGPAYRQQAQTLAAQGRHSQAAAALDHYLQQGGRSAEVFLARALLHSRLGEHAQAIEAYTRSLQVRPDPSVRAYRGWSYLRLEAARPGLVDFESVLREAPRNPDALLGRGLARAHLGQLEEAVGDAEAGLQAGIPTAQLWFNAACIYGRALLQMEKRLASSTGALRQARLYEERGLQCLREALAAESSSERGRFWREKVQRDPDLVAFRPTTGFLQLARAYAR
jgi:tetratricopeptide (TPR) repeat protein